MNIGAFNSICDRRCPVTAEEFLLLAERWLGRPTNIAQKGDVIELTWRHRRQVVAWVVLRRDPASGQWRPDLGGR